MVRRPRVAGAGGRRRWRGGRGGGRGGGRRWRSGGSGHRHAVPMLFLQFPGGQVPALLRRKAREVEAVERRHRVEWPTGLRARRILHESWRWLDDDCSR